jgi:hypothetical protein
MAFGPALVGLAFGVEVLAAPPSGPARAMTSVEVANAANEVLKDVPVTFGQIFKRGDLPPDQGLAARGPDRKPLPLQWDAKAKHRDGSARHGVVTVRLPRLAPGETAQVELLPAAPAAGGGGMELRELLLSAYDASAQLELGGETLTAHVKPLLSAAQKEGRPRTWLAGPLVTEWSVSGPLRRADGTPHPHLSVRFDVRAYAGLKAVRTDICIENTWAYEPNPSGFVYDVALKSGDRTVYVRKNLQHTHHARWHHVAWWGREPAVHIRHDRDYLMATEAVPHYDLRVKVRPQALQNMPAEYEPMENGGLTSGMPTGGAHSDIGPLPHFGAVYVLTMDPVARANTLANGGAGGAFQIHYRDKAKDLPLSIDDFPYAGLYGTPANKLNPKTGRSEAFPEVANPLQRHTPDDAHQPSVGYLPYLISGDPFFLDELHFWANYNLILMNPAYRQHERGVFGYGQMRAIAWNLRTLGEAAYITPDSHPLKRYFEEKLQNNIAAFNKAFPEDKEFKGQANRLGAIKWSEWDGFFRPWMDDFVTWSFGHLVELGYEEARPMLMYKCTFVVGRMTPPFHWQRAPMYQSIGKDAAGKYFTNFGDYYRANFKDEPTGLVMDGYPESPYGYGANMQPALSICVDAGAPGAREAWARYETRNPRQDYEGSPVWAVVPRK